MIADKQREAELGVLGASVGWYRLRLAERGAQAAGLERNASPTAQAPDRRAVLDAETALEAAVAAWLEAQ